MFAEPRLFKIEEGFEVACDEYGDPQGEPVFFFHGWPASRLQGAGFGPEGRALGLRIIALDRPGIGLSHFRTGRRLLDWPPVVKSVADQLGLERFRIAAVSGGGPYALATAWAMPDRVLAAAVISGAPPLPQGVENQLLPIYRAMLAFYRKRPDWLRSLFQAGRGLATLKPPRWLVSQVLRLGPANDRTALSEQRTFDGAFACYREAWRGSGLGVAADGEIYATPWGFEPEEIRVPVRLWHGEQDRSFNWKLAEALGRRIPNCQVKIVPEEGHYSLPIHHTHEILEDLKSCPITPRREDISRKPSRISHLRNQRSLRLNRPLPPHQRRARLPALRGFEPA